MKRRSFLKHIPAAVVLPLSLDPASAPDVPPRLDVREDPGCCLVPVKIFRHGRELEHVVAYDLEADFVTKYRVDPNGNPLVIGDEFGLESLHGHVTVEWDWEKLREDPGWKERTKAV